MEAWCMAHPYLTVLLTYFVLVTLSEIFGKCQHNK